MLSRSDYEKLQLPALDEDAVGDFLETINNDTLGRKVVIALNQRKQGHFDKAVLNISEANRDQVLAIREIQAILDKLAGRSKTEIILEKFRQTYPFQIGLTNGEEILGLLAEITAQYGNRISNIINELCNNEDQLNSLNEEIVF